MMGRKLIICALILLIGAPFSYAKKDKKDKTTVVPVELKTARDTLSYTLGLANTQGLLPYLQSRLNMDTAYIADFIKGFNECISRKQTPQLNAYTAGIEIGNQVKSQIIKKISEELKGSSDSLVQSLFIEGFRDGILKNYPLMRPDSAAIFASAKMTVIKEAKV